MTVADTDLDRQFAASTTLHGIGRLADSSKTYFKLAWFAVILACLGVCSWQITLRFLAYFEYGATTKVSTEYVGRLEFPAVTICNFNRYRLSATTPEERACLNLVIDVNDYNYYEFLSESFGSYWQAFFYDSSSDVDDSVNCTHFNFTQFTKRAGFVLDNKTLLYCDWRGRMDSCSSANFTHSFTSFGNCWTFNSGQNGADIVTEALPGSGNGLQVLIDIQQHEYTEGLDGYSEAGLKVLVHHQGTPPTVDLSGMAVAPGRHAYIATRALKFINLEPPWGKCNSSKTLENYKDYTLEGCMVECRARLVKKYCQCRLVRHPGNAVECTVSQTKNCGLRILAMIRSGEINECDCPIPCNYTRFITSLSTAAFPSKAVASQLPYYYSPADFDSSHFSSSYLNGSSSDRSGSYSSNFPNQYHSDYYLEYMRENLIVLDVFYEEINFQLYEQSIAITPSGLISDIGGQLGLFLGASFITLAEIMAYIGQKFQQTVGRRKKVRPSNRVIKVVSGQEVDLEWLV